MDSFKKPFYPSEHPACRYPYDLDLLKAEPAFPFHIMDGGAYLFLTDLLGGGWDGDMLAEKVMNGELFQAWTKDGKFHWDLPYKLYLTSKVPAPLEWLVWINRLYFLIPLANQYLKTGNEAYIEKWYECFESWCGANPYIAMEEDDVSLKRAVWSDDKNISQTISDSDGYVKSLVWRDMQVAWRLFSVVHSIAMMSGSKTLTEEKWSRIYAFLDLHAGQLLAEGREYVKRGSLHNHVLHMGTALLYVACLFPERPDSEEFLTVGKVLVELQLQGAIDADGGSDETCISYSHFIARLYVEAYLLLEKNGKGAIAGMLESIEKQYNWVYQMSAPNGRTLQFNDSYPLDALADIQRVQKLIPLAIKEKASQIYKASKCGVLRNGQFDLYFDGMKLTQVHQHAGRPNYVLYCGGKPLVVDSGCCGYDNHSMHRYFLGEWAHNTVCIYEDPACDKTVKCADSVEMTEASESQVSFKIRGERNGICFERHRTLTLTDDSVLIADEVTLSREAHMESRMHLAPLDVVKEGNTVYVHEAGTEQDIQICAEGDIAESEVDYKPAIGQDGRFTYSPVLVLRTKGSRACIRVKISRQK